MNWNVNRAAALVAICVSGFLALGEIAVADKGVGGTRHVTYADVRSAFNVELLAREGFQYGSAPGDGARNGRAMPLGGESHHCEFDWITVNITHFHDDSISRDEFNEIDASREYVFYLNETVHDHMSSVTKFTGWFFWWYKTYGYFIEPGELEKGFHTVGLTVYENGTEFASGDHSLEIVPHDDPDWPDGGHVQRLADGTWLIEGE